MFAKTSLILTLIVSLLFATQTPQLAQPVEMKPNGICAGMQCARGCCTNKACCHTVEQQKSPQTPIPASHDAQVQLTAVAVWTWNSLFVPPATRRSYVISDEASAAHTLPPLAANCIRLI